jgi:hypothetical protein
MLGSIDWLEITSSKLDWARPTATRTDDRCVVPKMLVAKRSLGTH